MPGARAGDQLFGEDKEVAGRDARILDVEIQFFAWAHRRDHGYAAAFSDAPTQPGSAGGRPGGARAVIGSHRALESRSLQDACGELGHRQLSLTGLGSSCAIDKVL